MAVITIDGSSLSGLNIPSPQQWFSDGSIIEKFDAYAEGHVMVATPTNTVNQKIQVYFPSHGQNGWDHYVIGRAQNADASGSNLNAYSVDFNNNGSGSVYVFKAVNGTWNLVDTITTTANATTVWTVEFETVGSTVEVRVYQYDWFLDQTVHLDTYVDSTSPHLTGKYGGWGSYFPCKVDNFVLQDLGGGPPLPTDSNKMFLVSS